MQQTNYDPESVLQLYEQLRSGTSRKAKDQANEHILAFLNSTQAWQVANELVGQGRPSEHQFIGAQIMYKKLESQFDDLANDAQVVEVRDNLFSMLVRVSQEGAAQQRGDAQNQVRLSQRVVVDRLCMCIALVALNTVNTCWMDSIKEVVTFGSENPHKCYLALLILKAISEEAETQHFSMRQKNQIESMMRDNLDKVLAFICQILQTRSQGQLPRECYLEAISASKSWCRYSTQTMVPNQEFVQIIFQMMESDREMFSKAISVVKKLLIESKYVKVLEHNSEAAAFNTIPDVEKQFLQSVVMYCVRQRDNFVTETQKPFDEADDEDEPFARKFCNLVTVLCSDYEILLINQTDEASSLLTLLKDSAKAVNQRIAIQSLDFWLCFYDTITQRISNLKQYNHLFTHYYEVSQLLLLACQRVPSIEYAGMQPEDVQELEVQERGVDVVTFRSHVEDILLKTYFLHVRHYGADGANQVFGMILNTLNEGLSDPFKAEVAFFGARSLLDGLEDDVPDAATLSFMGSLIGYFLGNQTARESFIVAKGVILFIDQAAKMFTHCSQHLGGIVSYLFDIFTRHPQLQSKALSTLLEFALYCKEQFTMEIVTAIHTFLSQQYASLSLEHAKTLAETLAMTISAIDKANFAQNMRQVTAMPLETLAVMNDQTNREAILKAIDLLTATTKAVEDQSTAELLPVLLPLFEQTWPMLVWVLQARSTDQGLVDSCCENIIRLAKALKTELTPSFSTIQQQLVQTFSANPKNFKCLETLTVLIKIIGQENPQIQQEISGSVEGLCQLILPKTMKASLKLGMDDTFANRVDVDVVTQFAALLYWIVNINAEVFLQTPSFDQCMTFFSQVISQINQAEMLTESVNLLLIVIQSVTRASPACQQKALAHYNTLVVSLMAATALDRGSKSIVGKVSQCLTSILSQAEMLGQLEGIRGAITGSFDACPALQGVEQRVRTSFIFVLMTLRSDLYKVKLALQTLNRNIQGLASADEFLGLEITAKHTEEKLKQAAVSGQQQSQPEVIHI